MRRSILRLLAIVFVFGLVAAACGDDSDNGESGSGTTAADSGEDGTTEDGEASGEAPEGDPIVLGSVVPFSGPQASLGELAQQGADLAVEQINDEGGVLGRPIEVDYRDDQAKTDEAVRIVRELNEEGVKFTWGYPTSAGCLAVAPIVEQLDMLMASSYCQTNKVIGEDFTENFFRVVTSAEMLTRAGAKAVQQEAPDATTWVSISPDYEYGHNTVNIFKNEMRNEVPGFEMLNETWPPFQAPSYSDYITQIANDPADGVFSTLFAGDMLNMLKQQKPFGLLDDKVFLTLGMDLDVIGPMAESGDLPETWDSVAYYWDAFDNEENTQFVEAFEEKYGLKPTLYPTTGYVAVKAYARAIEEAGDTDVDAVRDAMAGLEFETPFGPTTIREEDHQAVFENLAVIKLVPTDTGERYEIPEVVLVPGEEVTSPPNPGEPNPFDAES